MSQPTKALSVRAPWWWFIVHGYKPVENRDWPTSFRGTVYIHASAWWVKRDIAVLVNAVAYILAQVGIDADTIPLTEADLHGASGRIVGQVDIVDCVEASDSPWFNGRYGFVLANPVAFAKPMACKGMLGFFTVPADVLAQIERSR